MTSPTRIAQKVDCDYADPTMGFTMMSTDSGSHGALEGKEEDAGTLLTTASSCTATWANTTITPSTTQCYKLVFNPNRFETVWDLDVSG